MTNSSVFPNIGKEENVHSNYDSCHLCDGKQAQDWAVEFSLSLKFIYEQNTIGFLQLPALASSSVIGNSDSSYFKVFPQGDEMDASLKEIMLNSVVCQNQL